MSPEAREHSFDELTRGLASGSISRGKALRLMGAALVGGALGSLGGVAAADEDEDCKRAGKKCRKNHQCCSGNCVRGTCSACPEGRVLLENGTCATSCTTAAQCGFDPCGCASSRNLCGNTQTVSNTCSRDLDCAVGSFCNSFIGRCMSAC